MVETTELTAVNDTVAESVVDAPQKQLQPSNIHNQTKKRRRPASADSFTRVAASTSTSQTSGRGSEAGWTRCPLCGRHSQKFFAQGRGIAAHLHAVHTPWKPGKVERQKRRRLAERKKREEAQADKEMANTTTTTTPENQRETDSHTWEPTISEVDQWNKRVLQIVNELEEEHKAKVKHEAEDASSLNKISSQANMNARGVDRQGHLQTTYRASLPPLLQAAADGSLEQLLAIIESHKTDSDVLKELKRTDRHQSTAEHWAAGGGHLDCLQLLLETRKRIEGPAKDDQDDDNNNNTKLKKVRRRDGKTCLHYAARNGRVNCIHFLIQECGHLVDEISGDGTTPFHLACFGGHLNAMEVFLTRYCCSATHANDFGCNAAHWLGMTKKGEESDTETVRKMCRMLQTYQLNFVEPQKQGHSACHKAAQRQNKHVIQWLAQSQDEGGAGLSKEEIVKAGHPDEGGHTPSQIWKSVGGDEVFGDWMEKEMRW